MHLRRGIVAAVLAVSAMSSVRAQTVSAGGYSLTVIGDLGGPRNMRYNGYDVSADGKTLWLSGRFDDVVYAIDTTSGAVRSIPVGMEPHGLTVWPQPGRYSLGHTGNMR
ncbi:hypothetical protein C3E98_037880 [Pseudomonas sp. MWU13-2625]|nr:hypothetical protein C3E98_037880 [Pseudomonas sp. MWU13-2625]